MIELRTIRRWERPNSWWGKHWDGWYVALARTRDSDALTGSNFRVLKAQLDELPLFEVDDSRNKRGGFYEDRFNWTRVSGVQLVRESHWACGWVEWIAIHESNEEALRVADEALCALSDYPVLDEEDFSMLETEQIDNYWQQEPIRYRIELCAKCEESIFAARRDYPPNNVFDYLRDTWQ